MTEAEFFKQCDAAMDIWEDDGTSELTNFVWQTVTGHTVPTNDMHAWFSDWLVWAAR